MQHCPEPKNAEDHELQDKGDKSYVRGRIAYVTPLPFTSREPDDIC